MGWAGWAGVGVAVWGGVVGGEVEGWVWDEVGVGVGLGLWEDGVAVRDGMWTRLGGIR